MTEQKHTPGPWEFVPSTESHGAYVCGPWGSTVCDCYTMTSPSPFNGYTSKPVPFHAEAADANARLIAAAPDLLAEVKDWLRDSDGWSVAELRKRYDEKTVQRILRSRAAIAEAEGKE